MSKTSRWFLFYRIRLWFIRTPEDQVFKILEPLGDGQQYQIIEEMVYQFLPSIHLHGNPQRKREAAQEGYEHRKYEFNNG